MTSAEVMLGLLDESHVPTPGRKCAQRHLSEYGQPFDELDWPDHNEERTLIPETPLAVLGLMGLCQALEARGSATSPRNNSPPRRSRRAVSVRHC